MLNSYFTVKKEGSDEVVIQKSRFIGYVKRTETEESAQAFIKAIKKKHHDATHNCSAYMIGEHDYIQKANDDGEPSGTAGVPILNVLKQQALKDTTIVITRYFGGIKLGAGGLIRAYSSTTSKAIATTGVVKRQLMQLMVVKADYTWLGKLENSLRNSDYILEDIVYSDKVELYVFTESGQEDRFQDWITELTSNQAHVSKDDVSYLELDA